MGRVIAIANQKGGVAKTTTAANLGAALSQAGARVLLLDMDPQGSLTVWAGRDPDRLEKSLYDSLVKGVSSPEILLKTPLGADLLPANIDLSLAEMELVGMVARERRLASVLAPLRDQYDFVLIDCQPSLGLLTLNAFCVADEVLVPVACEFLSTRAIHVLLRMIGKVKLRLNSRLAVAGILPTMFDRRLRHSQKELDELVRQFAGQVPVLVDCAVPRSIRFAEAAAAGRSILEFAPLHPGAEAYRRLAGHVQSGEPLATARSAPAWTNGGPVKGLTSSRPAAVAGKSLGGPGPGLDGGDVDEPRVDVLVRKSSSRRRR